MAGDEGPWRRGARQAKHAFLHRLFVSARSRKDLASTFHRFYFDQEALNATHSDTYWLGVPTLKLPFDLWMCQELVHRLRPAFLVETGTYHGGSALFFASLFDLMGHGHVLTIDVTHRPDRPAHNRVTYLKGSSTDRQTVEAVRTRIGTGSPVMVVLDSDHTAPHVARELELYSPLVTEDSYLVVKDTNLNGHPVRPGFGPGPGEATRAFLASGSHFDVDTECEKFILTYKPGGYRRRRRTL